MPFRDVLHSLKNKWEDFQHDQNSFPGQQQQQYQPQYPNQFPNQPPPVPYASRPSATNVPQNYQPKIYWQPRFDPSIPVNVDWDQKQGNNNGWGNAELENYTSRPENSFYTSDHKLVIRAITSNHPSTPPEFRHTSARLVSRATLSRPRGSLTAVLTLPCAPGIWPAYWLLPVEPFTWPHEGEVDIAETWNGERKNHSCLHWGFYTPEDTQKHRVVSTDIPDMPTRPVRFEFAWDEQSRRMIWWVDGRPVMKAMIPDGTRPLSQWTVLLNVAMGGNVCAGQVPSDGYYDLVVHELRMCEEPDIAGWARFEADWNACPEGHAL